jgi:hypothetical protein
VATTITCEVGRSGSYGVRASVNNHVFIECGVMRGGSRAPDIKIRTGVGAGILTIHEWQPVDAADDVDHLKPFRVNFSANAASAEKSILYDDGTSGELWSTGTLDGATPVSDGVQLTVDAPAFDFDDYADGNLSLNSDWISCGNVGMYAGDYDTAKPGKELRFINGYNAFSVYRYSPSGNVLSFDAYVKLMVPSGSNLANSSGIMFYGEGSGTAFRGYRIYHQWGSNSVRWQRMYDSDSYFGVTTNSWYFVTSVVNTWYWLAIRVLNNNLTSVQAWAKFWKDGDPEPATWTYGNADTWRPNPATANVGLAASGSSTTSTHYLDDFSYVPSPATYETEGTWESGEIDVTSTALYSRATVQWDETLPSNTIASVLARWRAGGSWLACTNGGEIPGIDVGEAMTAGSSKDSLELRVELETTDTSATPYVGNLAVDFVPFDPAGLEIELDSGTLSCVTADSSLEVWGMRRIIGGANDIGYSDLWAETHQPYHLFLDDKALQAALLYGGWEIGFIVVSLARDKWMESSAFAGFQFSMDPIKYEGPPIECRYNVHDRWSPMGHGYEWVLLDRGIAIHADGWYIVGHIQIDNHPGSLLVGHRELENHPGELLVKGIRRDNHIGELLVQGWRGDNHPGMLMAAMEFADNHPGSFLVGIREREGHPGSFLVYGVNRDGAIFVNVINDTTYAKLVEAGIVMT